MEGGDIRVGRADLAAALRELSSGLCDDKEGWDGMVGGHQGRTYLYIFNRSTLYRRRQRNTVKPSSSY